MTGAPDNIKKIQFEIWLAKTPEERLTEFLMDNDAVFKADIQAKKDWAFNTTCWKITENNHQLPH